MDRRKLLLVVAVVVALIGAGLVFLYAKGADDRAAEAYRPATVFVATGDIAVGEPFDTALADGRIVAREVPENTVVPSAIPSQDVLAGKTANSPIYAGEQILTTNYGGEGANAPLAIPDGMVAVSVQLSDTARVAGFVNAGSNVAVWLTHEAKKAGGDETIQETRLLLDRVQVIAVGSTSTQVTTTSSVEGEVDATETMPRTMMTLAVEQADAERLTLGARVGELSFGLLTEKSSVKTSKGTDADSIFR